MPLTLPTPPFVVLALIAGRDALLLVGLVLATVGLLRMGYLRRRRSQQAGRLSPEEMVERNRQMRGMQGDLEQLMSEIEQLSRRFAAQLDAKSRRIERLLEKADHRIQGLLDLEDSQRQRTTPAPDAAADARSANRARNPQPQPAAIDDDVDVLDPLAEKVYQLADQGREPQQIARELDEHIGKIELILALRTAT